MGYSFYHVKTYALWNPFSMFRHNAVPPAVLSVRFRDENTAPGAVPIVSETGPAFIAGLDPVYSTFLPVE